MKAKSTLALITAFAAAVVLSASVYAAAIAVIITETQVGSGPETLSVSLPGVTIGGITDDWTLDFNPAGVTISDNDLPQVWVEPLGDPGFNVLSHLGGNILSLLSEAPDTGTDDNYCGTGAPLALGVTCFIGSDASGNTYFATINEVKLAPVPEPASIVLLGVGLVGLAAIRRRRSQHS